jgi:hypothetical protein
MNNKARLNRTENYTGLAHSLFASVMHQLDNIRVILEYHCQCLKGRKTERNQIEFLRGRETYLNIVFLYTLVSLNFTRSFYQ